MKKGILIISVFLLSLLCISQQPGNASLKLWYNQPAVKWTEALPIGNGRLGAMVFGRVQEELIQLNEATLWTGGPVNLNPNPEVNMNWKNNQIFNATIISFGGDKCKLRTDVPVAVKGVSAKSVKEEHGYVISFPTQKGKTYQVVRQ